MSNTTRIQFIGDGKLTTFAFPFQIFSTEDVVVYLDNIKQTENFSVTKTQESTATVTFNTAPAEGCFITLIRELNPCRKSHFYEGGALHAKVLNEEFDYQVACIKQLSDTQKRSLVLEPQANASDLTIPQPSGGKALIWSDDGTKLVNSEENFSNVINQAITQSQTATLAAQTATQAAQTATKAAQDAITKALTNPMEQNGDLIVGGENGTPTKISIGNIGQALSVGEQGLCYQDFAFPTLSNITSEAKKQVCSYAMPSDNYIDYPFSTPVTTLLTAPANGYFCAFVVNSSTKSFFGFKNTTTGVNATTQINTDVGNGTGLILPVRKNDVVHYSYLNINTTHEAAYIRFYYAEGEE